MDAKETRPEKNVLQNKCVTLVCAQQKLDSQTFFIYLRIFAHQCKTFDRQKIIIYREISKVPENINKLFIKQKHDFVYNSLFKLVANLFKVLLYAIDVRFQLKRTALSAKQLEKVKVLSHSKQY